MAYLIFHEIYVTFTNVHLRGAVMNLKFSGKAEFFFLYCTIERIIIKKVKSSAFNVPTCQ